MFSHPSLVEFLDFFELSLSYLDVSFLGLALGEWFLGFLAVFFGAVMHNLFARFLSMLMRPLVIRFTPRASGEKIMDALEGPLGYVPLVLVFLFLGSFYQSDTSLVFYAVRMAESIVLILLFWSLANVAHILKDSFARLMPQVPEAIRFWFIRIVRILLWITGFALVLEVWGVAVGPIIGGLGLLGIAVALGAQDLFKNLIAGTIITLEGKLEVGESVYIDGTVEGSIADIGLRTTTITRYDQFPVTVPNAIFSEKPVINYSRANHRRIYWKIGLVYGSSIEQLKEITEKLSLFLEENSAFESSAGKGHYVYIDGFNASSIDIMVYCFSSSGAWTDYLKAKQILAEYLMLLVEKVGTSFAYPTQTVEVKGLSEEIFAAKE